MKKISISVLSVLLSILMLFGLTACGDDSSSNSDSGSSSVESKTQKSKLSDFLESDIITEQLDTVKEQFGSLMDIDIYAADDSTLVFGFTYKFEIPESQFDVMKETFGQSFTSMSSTYEKIAATVGKALNIDNMCVRLEFYAKDGTKLFSKDFYDGGDDSSSKSDSGSSSVESKTQKSKLSEFLESDLIADQLDTVKEQFGSLMDIDVYAADDATLVYGFTYKDEIPESQFDVMKETFEQTFTSMSSTYEQIAATVGKALDIDNMCVRVEFFTNDGTMLFSKDFYAGGGSSESGFSL